VPLRVGAAFAIAAVWLLAGTPASASSLDGCSGTAESVGPDGKALDAASASGGSIEDTQGGGEGFTASNPFVVDNEGVVTYSGSSDGVITDHTWTISMLGVEVASGGSANESGTSEDDGDFDLGEELPFAFTGLVRVEGELEGTGGSCKGDGFVKVEGSPFASPITWAGLVLTGLGAFGVLLSLPRVRPALGTSA
jgi:hypothetical protein